MTYLHDPRVTEVEISVRVKIAQGGGEATRTLHFTEAEHGREIVGQFADLILSACDLATAGTREGRQK